ncbi:hypothetical protein KQX54_008732 [Cotesia glomerata]|uniref:Uncharacterized protein n=1 Tax=Cotesia glomerata TaxID=32391 RepID=A0AAV7I852_COTGL|nr:hypothetical protein KQX54_008732 [Cotesia glomerata]
MAQRYNFSVSTTRLKPPYCHSAKFPRDMSIEECFSRTVKLIGPRPIQEAGCFEKNQLIFRTRWNIDRLKGVLERLKSRLKEMNPGKQEAPSPRRNPACPKETKGVKKNRRLFTALCYSFSHFCEVKEVTDVV